MVETISPVVHGGRTKSYWFNLFLHTLAATTAAGLLGAALGAIGAAMGAPWGPVGLVSIVAVALPVTVRDLFGLPLPLPDLERQVPEWWRTFFSRPVASILYGLGLGVAFYTSLTFGTFVVVAAVTLATGDPALGALLCAPFGLGRALVVAAGDVDRIDLDQQRFLGRANGLASAALGVWAVALLAA